jgi:hypothetical protein
MVLHILFNCSIIDNEPLFLGFVPWNSKKFVSQLGKLPIEMSMNLRLSNSNIRENYSQSDVQDFGEDHDFVGLLHQD